MLEDDDLGSLRKEEEAEVAVVLVFGESVFEKEAWLPDFLTPMLLKRSSIDFCFIFSAPWLLLLLGLGILTGEPPMLTKTFVLLTDLFIGGFGPPEAAGLMEGKPLESPELLRPGRTGEVRVLAGGEGVRSFLGGETGRAGTGGLGDAEDAVEDWDFPPSRKPLPLKGIMFLISCDPEPE